MKYKELNQKIASENRFFSFALPLGREKRKDLAVKIEVFERLPIDIVVYSVTLQIGYKE